MSTKKLVLLALAAGAVFGLYYAGAPAPDTRPAPPAGLRGTLTAAPARVLHGCGVAGARIVAPAVRNMVNSTERELELVRHDLRSARGPLTHLNSVREGIRRVAEMDSSALASLAAGRPVKAFKDAMQANGLIAGVQDNMRAE